MRDGRIAGVAREEGASCNAPAVNKEYVRAGNPFSAPELKKKEKGDPIAQVSPFLASFPLFCSLFPVHGPCRAFGPLFLPEILSCPCPVPIAARRLLPSA